MDWCSFCGCSVVKIIKKKWPFPYIFIVRVYTKYTLPIQRHICPWKETFLAPPKQSDSPTEYHVANSFSFLQCYKIHARPSGKIYVVHVYVAVTNPRENKSMPANASFMSLHRIPNVNVFAKNMPERKKSPLWLHLSRGSRQIRVIARP